MHLVTKQRALEAQVQQCIGEETGFVGDSNITVAIDPALPGAVPSNFPFDRSSANLRCSAAQVFNSPR
jgi:hypothetical protein